MADLVERLRERAASIRRLRRQTPADIRDAELDEAAAAALEAEASEGERRGLELVLNMQAPIDSMCMTYRHDFGLPKGMNSYGNGSSGMTERDRDALRLTMRQVWEHAVLHAIRALIPEAPVREGWRPIETAPNDDPLRSILIATRAYAGGVVQVSWSDTHQDFVDQNEDTYPDATHWIAMPAPPSQDHREG